MRRTLLVLVALTLPVLWATSAAIGQQSPTPSSQNTTLAERLDNFGRKLLNGVFPAKKPRSSGSHSSHGRASTSRTSKQSSTARSGSVTSPESKRVVSSQAPQRSVQLPGGRSHHLSGLPSRTSPATSTTQSPSPKISVSRPEKPSVSPAPTTSDSTAKSATSGAPRIHDRLRSLTESAFSGTPRPNLSAKSSVATGPTRASQPTTTNRTADDSSRDAGVTRPSLAPKRSPVAPRVAGQVVADSPRPVVMEPTRAAPRSVELTKRANESVAEKSTPEPTPSIEATAPSGPAQPEATDDVLFARQSPVLGVETIGPRRIKVGKESTYEVTLRNTGQVGAEGVVVTIALPEWTDVLGADASQGATTSTQSDGFRWEVERVEPGAKEKLVLRIVPRQSRPFDLAVKCDYTPVASQAMIEVQEPKLEMRFEGPRRVLYGQAEVYRLEVVNSGNGDAEDVEISLVPVGAGENVSAVHKLGVVKAGEEKSIEVELTARQPGTLIVRVDVQGDGGLEAHLAEEITVLRPALETDVQAPRIQYVGTNATYRVRVSNPGTAEAKSVTVTATIPLGAEYVSDTANGEVSSDRTSVTWTLSDLDIDAARTLELTCKLTRAGSSRLNVVSSAEGGLAATGNATVTVEAIADLELDVTDPAGPVPVGSEATYQVRVQNRGTKSAEEVEVVAYFSNGIEPTSVEGGRYDTAPGQVLFNKIASLAAGQDLTFKIKAKAATAGNHVCRVEVLCKPLGTRLISEETTHFYGGAESSQQGTDVSTESARENSPTLEEPARTADERPRYAPPKG